MFTHQQSLCGIQKLADWQNPVTEGQIKRSDRYSNIISKC